MRDRFPDKLIGEEPEVLALLRHLSPTAKMSSAEKQHLSVSLPAANIKTREQRHGPK